MEKQLQERDRNLMRSRETVETQTNGRNRQRAVWKDRDIASHSVKHRGCHEDAQRLPEAGTATEWLEWVGAEGSGEVGGGFSLTLGLSAEEESEGRCTEDHPNLPRSPGGDGSGGELGLRAVPGA